MYLSATAVIWIVAQAAGLEDQDLGVEPEDFGFLPLVGAVPVLE
jgi:hypothetical protein